MFHGDSPIENNHDGGGNMNRIFIGLVIALTASQVACSLSAGMGARQPANVNASRFATRPPAYWPTSSWRESSPEEQGMSSSSLAKAVDHASQQALPIHNLLIVRHGVVVLDANFYPFSLSARHDIASITKSVTSLLVGAAVERGILPRPETLLFDVLRNRPSRIDSRKGAMSLANLLGMQSGLDCGFARGELELHAMMKATDWVQSIIDLPMRSTPGTEIGYCSGNYHLLSAAITSRAGMSELEFARQALFDPLGITDVVWPTDPSGLNHGWGDLQLRPRDLAKIGFLMLHGGEWDGRTLVSRDWITWSTQPRVKYGDNNLYGYGWWTHPTSPNGFYEGIGRGGQRLSVWPEKDIIVVMTGGGFRPDDLSSFLLEAIIADSAVTRNADSEARLLSSARRAAAVPIAQRTAVPACAASVSGVTYLVGMNSMDLRTFTLEFPSVDSTIARLQVGKYSLVLPVGMDGIYRRASTLIDGIAPATRGTWRSPCEFVLDLNLVGKIDRYTLAIAFDHGKAHMSLAEATGLVKEETSAAASDR
jgi:CubicO group peptidase (beta-lactamase class C family)